MSTIGVLKSFAGSRILVTGHTGFKGSWMAFLLKEIGADVMGVALPPESERSHFAMLGLEQDVRHVIADIRDGPRLNDAVQSFQPEYVIHMAAQALVRRSYEEPAATFNTNVMGSVHLLEAVRRCASVRSLVYVTSDKCYENVEWVWGYRENDRLGGRDPYSASKAAAEMVFAAYASSFFSARHDLGAATARAGNVIGGGDWAKDRIVPDCIRAVEAKKAVQLRNPGATRPWQHVLETTFGYLLLAAKLRQEPQRYAGSWNFGPSSADVRTVEEIANSIGRCFDQDIVEIAEGAEQQQEAGVLQVNCDKAHHLLDWHPRWTVDKALAATAEWYKAVLNGADAKVITRSQVQEYLPGLA